MSPTQVCRHVTLFSITQLNFYFEPSFWHVTKSISVIFNFISFPWDSSTYIPGDGTFHLGLSILHVGPRGDVKCSIQSSCTNFLGARVGASCHFCILPALRLIRPLYITQVLSLEHAAGSPGRQVVSDSTISDRQFLIQQVWGGVPEWHVYKCPVDKMLLMLDHTLRNTVLKHAKA